MFSLLAATVLFFVPTNTYNIHSNIIHEWKNQVKTEGWTVNQQLIENSIFTESKTTRTNKVKFIFDKIREIKPKAVFFCGPVARIATGWSADDGHNQRCVWNDFFYNGCIEWNELTDNKNYTNPPTGLFAYKNIIGDGRFDQSYVINTAKWAVGRVDFSNLPLISRGLINNTNSYLYGKEKVPLVDENAALNDYFVRNLNYRRGLTRYENIASLSSSYLNTNELAKLKLYRTNISFIVNNNFISNNPYIGRKLFMYYLMGQDYRNSHYLSDLNEMINVVWFANYRSYEYEQTCENNPNQQGDQGNRRWLQWALFVTWGPPRADFLSGKTLADSYLNIYGKQNIYSASIQIDGDPTLPLTVIQNTNIVVNKPTGLRFK